MRICKVRRLQKEISTSKLSWSVAALTTLLLWFVAWLEDHVTFLPFVLLMVSGLLMMWMNHLFALIRVYSRMIASSFLAFNLAFLMAPDIGGMQLQVTFMQFCVIVFLILFFSCYQYRRAQGVILYAFLMIGLASLVFKQILFLVPILWLLTGYCMVTFSVKILLSSIFGVSLPYVFLLTYYFMVGTPLEEWTLVHNWNFCHTFDFSGIKMQVMLAFVCASVLSIIGMSHLIHEGHRDKVRTRMMYQIFFALFLFSFAMTLLQPANMLMFTALQLIATSAMIGHFFALTDTKRTNVVFITILSLTYIITLFNLIYTS